MKHYVSHIEKKYLTCHKITFILMFSQKRIRLGDYSIIIEIIIAFHQHSVYRQYIKKHDYFNIVQ